jgi:CheY-like chemotaxis protein
VITSQPVFMYIEDDFASREIIKVLITRVMGFSKLIVLENSRDFLTRIDRLETAPNVFFLDIQMKPLDGYEVLEILRADPRFQHATIIAMTANVMSHDVEKLRQVGFSGLIGKPIMKDTFPQLVQRILADESVWYVP